jgi:serralysin
LSLILKNEGLILEFANKMDSIKKKQTKMNSNENKQKTAVVLVGAAAILAISAGFIPTIGMTAWAALIQCQPAQPCNGTAQSDAIRGTEGADKISALGGNDAVDARGGNDNVTGGSGNDLLSGGNGNDRVNGGSGNDLLSGGSGDDTFTGGPGADRFSCGDGVDTITDFNAAQGDAKTTDCENF